MRHPAVYTNMIIPILAELLKSCKSVLDPFGGTGKLSLIKDYGYQGLIICNEIEQEWSDSDHKVDEWHIGDAVNMYWAANNRFDAICTSPTYGNRMADHFNAKDNSKRITYKHYLGRDLDNENTGRMQWGDKYRAKHKEIYLECFRVLKIGGLFILNISDHIRKGQIVEVTKFHQQCLIETGLRFQKEIVVKTPRMRFGQNHNLRVDHESILLFAK